MRAARARGGLTVYSALIPLHSHSSLQITEDREKEMRQDLDDLHGRHVELKRKFRTLYLAYRQLR